MKVMSYYAGIRWAEQNALGTVSFLTAKGAVTVTAFGTLGFIDIENPICAFCAIS